MGLNVVVGLAGLLDLGYAAFFAIGAYTYAYCELAVLGPRPAVPADARRRRARSRRSSASLLGAPTLRLRGDYLAIMTLGFGEIVPIVFLNLDHVHRGHERDRRRSTGPSRCRSLGAFTRAHAVRLLHPDGRASSRSR